MASIGNVTAMYIKSVDALSNDYETLINKKIKINPSATYQNVDTAARALNYLSTNTYQDTKLVTEVSVNDKLAE